MISTRYHGGQLFEFSGQIEDREKVFSNEVSTVRTAEQRAKADTIDRSIRLHSKNSKLTLHQSESEFKVFGRCGATYSGGSTASFWYHFAKHQVDCSRGYGHESGICEARVQIILTVDITIDSVNDSV